MHVKDTKEEKTHSCTHTDDNTVCDKCLGDYVLCEKCKCDPCECNKTSFRHQKNDWEEEFEELDFIKDFDIDNRYYNFPNKKEIKQFIQSLLKKEIKKMADEIKQDINNKEFEEIYSEPNTKHCVLYEDQIFENINSSNKRLESVYTIHFGMGENKKIQNFITEFIK